MSLSCNGRRRPSAKPSSAGSVSPGSCWWRPTRHRRRRGTHSPTGFAFPPTTATCGHASTCSHAVRACGGRPKARFPADHYRSVFPRAGAALVRTAHTAVGPSAGWGAIIAIGVPVVAGFAISTLVGLPLGLGALIALCLLFCLGYVVSAAALGGLILKEMAPLVAFLAGFGILRVVAIIPGLGLLAWILASAYGIGVLAVASYRAGHGDGTPDQPAPAAEPAPTAS